jgi:hypothetical protein
MGLHDFVKAMPVTKSVCTRNATLNILTGVWGNGPATLTLFEAVSYLAVVEAMPITNAICRAKSVVVCYKTIKKEQKSTNKYVLLASSIKRETS